MSESEHSSGSNTQYAKIDNRKNQLANREANRTNLKGNVKLLPREKRTALADISTYSSSQTQIYADREKDKELLSEVPRSNLRREGTELIYNEVKKKRKILEDKDSNQHFIPAVTQDVKPLDLKELSVSKSNTWKNLDEDEKDDVLLVAEYTNDIFSHLYSREDATVPAHNYTIKSGRLYYRPSVRAILIDWLVEVHEKFQCFPETLLLAINIMDRFLVANKVSTDKLQLVAVTALFIAAKYEEIHLPKLAEYAYITAGAATKTSIKKAELFILAALKFDLGWPNPLNFIRRISKADDYDTDTRNVAKYLLEFSICSSRFIGIKSSQLAVMAMYIARRIINRNQILWDKNLEHYSGDLNPLQDMELQQHCIDLIKDIVTPLTPIKSLTTKYENEERYGVSLSMVDKWCSDQIENDYKGLFSL